jgi:hypothetical protein
MKKLMTVLAMAGLLLAGCGSSGSSSSPSADAHTLAVKVKAGVSSVAKTQDLTEKTDGNKLLGRPGGFTSSTVLFDTNGHCVDGPGVDCGGSIEVFASHDEAKKRAAYIQSLTGADSPLGSEYDYVDGNAVLRVSGDLPPSVAKKYEAAFKS